MMQHLTDSFMELLAYVAYFRRAAGKRQPPFETVKADIHRLLGKSESNSPPGISREEYDQARFAVCVWVDETVLGSDWTHRAQWQREPLQRTYYNTSEGGEEFYERLNALGFHQREAREVFYLCLALGFKGRFCHPGDEVLLEQLRRSNLQILAGSSAGVTSLDRVELFPEAYPEEQVPTETQPREARFSWFTAACVAGPILLFGVLYVVYRFTLSGIGENLLKRIPY